VERKPVVTAFKNSQTKKKKKEIMSMVIEAMAEKEDKEESAARSALDKLLELL
jgi:hypothetical protein